MASIRENELVTVTTARVRCTTSGNENAPALSPIRPQSQLALQQYPVCVLQLLGCVEKPQIVDSRDRKDLLLFSYY
jgi:hypothetical protein